MNCPHCQNELPEKHAVDGCPFCQQVLPRKFNWLFFSLVLSAPTIAVLVLLTFISSSLDVLNVMFSISIFGSMFSGLVCGVYLAWLKRYGGVQLISAIILNSLGMTIASFGLCCLGCTVPAAIYSAVQTAVHAYTK